jgi:hypothetical protein
MSDKFFKQSLYVNLQKEKRMKNSLKIAAIGFILGLAVMFLLDMVFHFNNSIETQLKREMNKTQNKIENIFK